MSTTVRHIDVRVVRDLARPFRRGGAFSAATVLSGFVAALMVVESMLGLLVADLYPEAPWAVAALRGNDLVTLVVAAPVLVLGLVWARRRGSVTGGLLWLGALLYNVYNFAYYVFGTAFNDVFLLHVGTLALSLVALVLAASALDVDVATAGIVWDWRPRAVAAFMGLVGLALVAAWGGLSVRFALTGELPANVMPPEAVHLVYAIDLALLAPSFLLGAVLLWRREPWGHVMGVVVNAFAAMYLLALEVVGGFQANAGIEGATWLSVPTIVGPLLCVAAVVLLLYRPGHRA